LPDDVPVPSWFQQRLDQDDLADAVGLITSRRLSAFVSVTAEAENVEATCVATVGLSNAERVGATRRSSAPHAGTINILVTVSAALTEAAQIEALSIAAQARTAAVMEFGPIYSGSARMTGTGTDCIAIAAQAGDLPYCGLHTACGEAIGRAVYEAVAQGVGDWIAEQAEGAGAVQIV
jgi:adenosylcobinamide amidohydrolase